MYTSLFNVFFVFLASLAIVSSLPNGQPLADAAVTAAPDTQQSANVRTVIWSTTQTSVTHPLWIPATAVTMVTTQTLTTLIPEVTEAGAQTIETVVGRTTYEYRLGYSDGHSSTSWSSATRSYVMTVG